MRKYLLIIGVLLSLSLSAQNWNFFNTGIGSDLSDELIISSPYTSIQGFDFEYKISNNTSSDLPMFNLEIVLSNYNGSNWTCNAVTQYNQVIQAGDSLVYSFTALNNENDGFEILYTRIINSSDPSEYYESRCSVEMENVTIGSWSYYILCPYSGDLNVTEELSKPNIVSTSYYNFLGQEISNPELNQIYIAKQITDNGEVIYEKVYYMGY